VDGIRIYPQKYNNYVDKEKEIDMAYDPRAVLLTKQDKLTVSRVTDKALLRSHYKSLAQAVASNLRNKTRGNRKESSN
jgi:uncharacterized protein with PIN domain